MTPLLVTCRPHLMKRVDSKCTTQNLTLKKVLIHDTFGHIWQVCLLNEGSKQYILLFRILHTLRAKESKLFKMKEFG